MKSVGYTYKCQRQFLETLGFWPIGVIPEAAFGLPESRPAERVWPFPLEKDYDKALKGGVADIK